MALSNGAITTRMGKGGWEFGVFDSQGQRRLYLSVSLSELPQFAYFNSRGQTVVGDPAYER